MEIPRIDPPEARRRLEDDESLVYLDVRSQREFESGHAPGAVNVPLLDYPPGADSMAPNPEFVAQVKERFSTDTPLLTACLRGGRSLRAAQILAEAGFENITDMRGGWDGELDRSGNVVVPGWARLGFPTTS